MAMPHLSKATLLGSSTTMKDAYFEAKSSNAGFYNFAFKLLMPMCRHPLFFGDAADKATWRPSGSTK